MSIQAVIATNRFGLGAKPNEHKEVKKDPKAWLINQLNTTPAVSFDDDLPTSDEIAEALTELRLFKKSLNKKNANGSASLVSKTDQEKLKKLQKYPRNVYLTLSSDTLVQAIQSDNSLNWRLLDFFSNHFSVTAQGQVMTALAPTLEREAIAPHLLGSFEDMLLAVTQHPAMLIYLNNEKSFGPASKLGKKGKGLNENLAREILELHTLGVNGGYSQQDVTELAKGITGWSVSNFTKDKSVGFTYRGTGHEPNTRKLLGTSFNNNGLKQGESMLKYLARHSATAEHLCFKLARHFIADAPPQILVEKMVKRWKLSNGKIKDVVIEMINAEESWSEHSFKFKSPREFVISTFRGVGQNNIQGKQVLKALTVLGQRPFNAGSPAGYSDYQQDWNGASAIMSRIELSAQYAARRKPNAEKVLMNTLSDSASELTYNSVIRAESRQQAFTLLLMSPEFQRR
ncbi:DUF1800 domain-containing protein [Colwellia sp. RE-S-Sl-9]